MVRVAAILFPSSWLWGFDAPADLPQGIRVVAILGLVAATVPRLGTGTIRLFERLERPGNGTIAASAAIGAGLLAMMRCNNTLLGDGQTWLSAIDRGVRSAGGAHREPLPQAIVIGVHDHVIRQLGGNPHLTFTLIEIPLAALHLAAAALLARRIGGTPVSRALAFAAIGLTGALQLHAGYPEFYGFALVAILWFAVFALRALEHRGGFLPAAAVFAIALVCHAQALFALPSLLYVAWRLVRSGRGREVVAGASAMAGMVAALLVLVRYPFDELAAEAGSHANFLPPLGAWTRRTAYAIHHPAHLADLANAFLLASPAAAFLAPVVAWRRCGLRETPVRFLGILAAGPALFALAAHPQLGMARDWDIFALPATTVALALAAVAAHSRPEESPRGRALAGCILLACLVHSACWVASNHDAAAGRERIRRVARNSALFGPQSLGEVWRYLGSGDMMAGDRERAAESYLRAIAADPEERMTYRFLAGVHVERATSGGAGVEHGLASYQASLEGTSARRALIHMGGAFAAYSSRRLDLALAESERMVEADPLRAEVQATRGDFLRLAGDVVGARASYVRALERDADLPRARIGLACLEGMASNPAGVARELVEATRRTPWAPLVQQFSRAVQEQGGAGPAFYRSFIFLR